MGTWTNLNFLKKYLYKIMGNICGGASNKEKDL